ncbi:hypothetical protein LC608_18740 [Nostoc sp. XA010]|uniref:hypothetical protein n=1 Tax=Nostoc sp. XA010 TaxID=2780407 RepID=UPI001E570065|nr:hypothetical protein [Nostoc sp. XA010]MCC5658977.1 hypothetical protein [Nostoc sp. XA010]
MSNTNFSKNRFKPENPDEIRRLSGDLKQLGCEFHSLGLWVFLQKSKEAGEQGAGEKAETELVLRFTATLGDAARTRQGLLPLLPARTAPPPLR